MTARPSSPASPAWMRTPERSNMAMLRIMTWISLRLGRPAGRLVLHLVVAYFLLFAPASRRASKAYLQRVLGRPVTWSDRYRHFFSFASTIHDRIYLINQRFDLFNIEIRGQSALQDAHADGGGLFLIGAHMGSFEVIRAMGRQIPGLRVSMVMHEDNAQKINAMLAAINPNASTDIIGLGRIDSMLRVRDTLDQGAMVGMLADRSIGDDALLATPLLGSTAYLPTGSFRMAALLRRRVVFMVGLYLGGNRYQINFEPLADFSQTPTGQRGAQVQAAVQRYAALLDQYARQAPYNWFNFFDFWQAPAAVSDTNPK
ncbi:acyl-CoA synthetase [Rhodoferax ferrireducens]|uniref:LpxL/LpxP family acyltransferase n=1 Tax=Rhodoferax ferrireducens TaxID=192843 RepID=UPI000E0D7D63|nr:acyl-CoA synthetase [Rhodoferax ferrireducens]